MQNPKKKNENHLQHIPLFIKISLVISFKPEKQMDCQILKKINQIFGISNHLKEIFHIIDELRAEHF